MTPPGDEGVGGTERRGADGTPAEGRRGYDDTDSTIAKVDDMLGRIRRIGMGITFLLMLAMASFYWLGGRGMGPGSRSDQMQAELERYHTERVMNDSLQSQRITRLERVVAQMAYQSCMSGKNSDPNVCGKIFTDTP